MATTSSSLFVSQTGVRRHVYLLAAASFALILIIYYRPVRSNGSSFLPSTPLHGGSDVASYNTWDADVDANNLTLDSRTCDVFFPFLFHEVERAVSDRKGRHITKDELDAITPRNGYVRAMIYDQQLYVVATEGHIYSREIATLLALHRAIVSSPERLPNIEFAFNSDDRIESVALWAYARRAQDTNIWLMPDFGYWAWPETKVGTMGEVRMKATSLEKSQQWSSLGKKIPKLLWRGATMGLELRDRLVEVTRGKGWADVKALNWHDTQSMNTDLKTMDQHCEYKYLAHTEGNSYSGRLKYLQMCNSVIVAHKMDWIQHVHGLLKASGAEQNYVEVERDFSDLESRIQWLEAHPADASRIASNSIDTFRNRYHTSAAEACYWRRLIRGWSEVSFAPEFYKEVDGKKAWRGLPVESFVLERRLDWEPY